MDLIQVSMPFPVWNKRVTSKLDFSDMEICFAAKPGLLALVWELFVPAVGVGIKKRL